MTAETVSALINLGSAGAVIIVVAYFLEYLKKLDAQHNENLKALTSAISATAGKVELNSNKLDCVADDTGNIRDTTGKILTLVEKRRGMT
jgi:predicted CDP-diglyceride synthetase/phosphatidate cytidylyltransferase